ncbi:MAG: hypothetical protein EBY16_10075 [Gammaproteobacteria bacterium]|nr:hypothetical protein [Gammaproteobacteria bacterium]
MDKLVDNLRLHKHDEEYCKSIRGLLKDLAFAPNEKAKLALIKEYNSGSVFRNQSLGTVQQTMPALTSVCRKLQSSINYLDLGLFNSATREILKESIKELERKHGTNSIDVTALL